MRFLQNIRAVLAIALIASAAPIPAWVSWQRSRATRTFDQLAATGRALAVRLERMPDARTFDAVAGVLEKEGVAVPRHDAWGHAAIFAPYSYEGRLGGYALVSPGRDGQLDPETRVAVNRG